MPVGHTGQKPHGQTATQDRAQGEIMATRGGTRQAGDREPRTNASRDTKHNRIRDPTSRTNAKKITKVVDCKLNLQNTRENTEADEQPPRDANRRNPLQTERPECTGIKSPIMNQTKARPSSQDDHPRGQLT
ncbi:hypothetical protein R1flu_020516 [Riccia fluitans]|uniref:Uncharacterized protein n=1 Tax=Riccia fluitans TaxID=41844 RepID=A0ABD1ZLQ2_9MARC